MANGCNERSSSWILFLEYYGQLAMWGGFILHYGFQFNAWLTLLSGAAGNEGSYLA